MRLILCGQALTAHPSVDRRGGPTWRVKPPEALSRSTKGNDEVRLGRWVCRSGMRHALGVEAVVVCVSVQVCTRLMSDAT